MPSKIITEENKQEIISFYLSRPMALKEVEARFNLSAPTVSKILAAIPKYSKAKIYNPGLLESFFESIDEERKAYYLGLLISDGNVFQDGTGRQSSISITLDEKDEYILEDFKKTLHSNTKVSHDGRGNSQIAIRSNIMAEDLSNYGVVPRKSFITYLPTNIPKEMYPHLMRGILDGDGSIQAKQNGTRYLHSISFCGSHRLMQEMIEYIQSNLQIEGSLSVYDYKDRELSEFKIARVQDMYLFGEWIYGNASIFMKRKYETYLAFKQHYNLV